MFTQEIKNISSDIFIKVVSVRRELHKYPELGFQEFKTAATIAEYLDSLGLEVKTGIGGTGVTGLIRGAGPGKTIAIRADIDALPVTELNDCEYVSQNKGFMHACGHDAHIAIALGTAEILSRLKDRLSGNIKFIFQPAEEGLGGARNMIDGGVLEAPDVNAIIATHVFPALKAGQIALRPGPAMASPSEFEIVITGKGGHAAAPQGVPDPILTGASLIQLLQSIISREKDPADSAVLSVTCFHAGSAFNIIPDKAVIRGTVRTFDPLLDKHISRRIEEITASLTAAMGTGYQFTYSVGYPVLVNDEHIIRHIAGCAEKTIAREDIINNIKPFMVAEDFAYYLQKVPGAMFYLGCANSWPEAAHGLHSSKFNIDEGCLKVGMEIMAQCAVDFLGTK